MSDIIQLLPDSVANQIAAGEVIQRPASVIKELVENAVDAGAKNIHVVVVDAGRTCIQVIDDGIGMSETDARLSFERHATSKIRKADDLFALKTMGFRGEALASIAAVAQIELTTRQHESEIGTQLYIAGSKFTGQEPVACAVGSNFKVENLFYNIPARRKFLKSNATELNHILSAFERIVLVNPDIQFTLHSNGVELFNLRATSLRQRIIDVFGKKLNQELLPLEVDTAVCRISGFVGKPESAKKRTMHQFFFVNNRYMKHPYFHKAVMAVYERMIPTGTQIPYFIYIDVEAEEIDVNIHPTKTEIKFENEQAIWQILSAGVKDAIGKHCEIPSIDFDTEGSPSFPVFNTDEPSMAPPKVSYNPDYNPFRRNRESVSKDWEKLYEMPVRNEEPEEQQLFQPSLVATSDEMIAERSPVHYQYKGQYIMTAVKSGLMIIDQHRAHIRILFEEYMNDNSQQRVHAQKILFPEMLELSPSDALSLEQLLPEMALMGFEVSPLGGGSYVINATPTNIEGLNPVMLVEEIIAATKENDGYATSQKEVLALSLARHAAIPYGQVLGNEEMENIVNRLFTCSNVNHTPDGKPIFSIYSQRDIERLLG